ncbi:MAG: hypothetical protein BA867_06445 [Desulfobacterales bacterium S5133MH16]|nr:MAG: hypothetical protein BA867_06445 [Desulfobacterales bacterium S5133MH16]
MFSQDDQGDSNLSKKLRESIGTVLDQIDEGFKRAMLMYTVAFYAGIALILISIGGFLYGKDVSLIFGGMGIADIVAFFIFKPAEDLQISRGNLAQLQAAFTTWVNDIHNWNHFLKLKFDNQDCSTDDMEKISRSMIKNTLSIMEGIDLYVEGGKGKKIKKASLKKLEKLLANGKKKERNEVNKDLKNGNDNKPI